MKEPIGEIIPNFHNIEFRLKQLEEAIAANPVGRMKDAEVQDFVKKIQEHASAMCLGERLYREGKLPKRICHCDTKVNNMLFDQDGQVLCVIDLDTVMPGLALYDFGDAIRYGASTAAEDERDLDRVRMDPELC